MTEKIADFQKIFKKQLKVKTKPFDPGK